MSRILESDAPDFTDWQVTPQSRLRFQRVGKDLKTEYIHMLKLDETTRDRNWAWTGTGNQAKNVRKLYPHAKQFGLARVSHRRKS